jgi:dihydropteroate synthase
VGRAHPGTTPIPERDVHVVPFADGGGLRLGERTAVVGIVNVTPDSFSDGGNLFDPGDAIAAARKMVAEGADIIDVGGESTRPGADPVDETEEMRRVLPVIEAIKSETSARVSVDTTKASVAARAIDKGADLINDVTALSDPEMLPLLVETDVPVIVMHMRGTPRTMQRDTDYDDLMDELIVFLRASVQKAVEAGVTSDRIIVDPGIGFGKSASGNLRVLRELPTLREVGRPILIGASRKSFIGVSLDLPVTERLEASLGVASLAAWQGAHLVRVHDVRETVRAVRMIDAVRGAC